MSKKALKYTALLVAAVLLFEMVFAFSNPLEKGSALSAAIFSGIHDTVNDPAKFRQPITPLQSDTPPPTRERVEPMPGRENLYPPEAPQGAQNIQIIESLPAAADTLRRDSLSPEGLLPDSIANVPLDPGALPPQGPADSTQMDSVRYNNFLDDVISGHNKDSLVYNVKEKAVYIYKEGDVTYGKMNLKADFIRVEMDNKILHAYGVTDSLGKRTRPEFVDGGSPYTMDTITYNIDTERAKIKGVATQEGEGFLIGQNVKKHHDNSIHIKDGKYTTCDDPDCPHFYLAMTKAKVIPNKKVIIGPSYMVLEDVPLYFLMIPEGFFPMTSGRSSGLIIPSYGEEYIKGFFLRDGGYYFALGEHADLTLLAGIYTKGSWEASASSRYTKRYKFNGSFSARFSKDIIGEKGEDDYTNANNFSLTWTHTQDAKFRPNSTFSASVNFATSGYQKNSTTNINDYLNTQTNSSISYSKNWAGTPFSISMSMQQSQNSRDTTMSLSFPNAVINMSRINPFKRKNAVGKQRWYEKITMSYTGNISANANNIKEYDLFTEEMFKGMKYGIRHNIPISTSFNLFNYINMSPNVTYNEVWNFRKIEREWNDQTNRQEPADTTYGFYRIYNYSASMSASTKIYGTYLFKSKTFPVQAIRHTITPSVSMSYSPNFGDPRYGYYNPIQSDSLGTVSTYSPFSGELYQAPGSGQTASLNFSVGQTLEAKVLSKTDTSGVKKVKIIDNFSFSGSYNFLADSMNLSNIGLNLRMTLPFLKNFGLSLTATLDPYEVVDLTGTGRATRINKLMLRRGKIGRIASTSWSFGYTFNGGKAEGGPPAVNDLNSQMGINDMYALNPHYYDPDNPIDPTLRRQMMVANYYDFSIPWNLGFNYSVRYTNDGLNKNVNQTLQFNGSVTLTPKWGVTFSGGFDFATKKLTPGVFTLSRDLHCWQFNFNWVPVGYRKSWSFNISVKSAMLKDLKYDKRSSHYDNLYDSQ